MTPMIPVQIQSPRPIPLVRVASAICSIHNVQLRADAPAVGTWVWVGRGLGVGTSRFAAVGGYHAAPGRACLDARLLRHRLEEDHAVQIHLCSAQPCHTAHNTIPR